MFSLASFPTFYISCYHSASFHCAIWHASKLVPCTPPSFKLTGNCNNMPAMRLRSLKHTHFSETVTEKPHHPLILSWLPAISECCYEDAGMSHLLLGSVIEQISKPLHLHVPSFCSRREDKLRIPNGWLCHLAPEIIQQLSPDTEEDKLPFSKQSDVFAFGWVSSNLMPSCLLVRTSLMFDSHSPLLTQQVYRPKICAWIQ